MASRCATAKGEMSMGKSTNDFEKGKNKGSGGDNRSKGDMKGKGCDTHHAAKGKPVSKGDVKGPHASKGDLKGKPHIPHDAAKGELISNGCVKGKPAKGEGKVTSKGDVKGKPVNASKGLEKGNVAEVVKGNTENTKGEKGKGKLGKDFVTDSKGYKGKDYVTDSKGYKGKDYVTDSKGYKGKDYVTDSKGYKKGKDHATDSKDDKGKDFVTDSKGYKGKDFVTDSKGYKGKGLSDMGKGKPNTDPTTCAAVVPVEKKPVETKPVDPATSGDKTEKPKDCGYILETHENTGALVFKCIFFMLSLRIHACLFLSILHIHIRQDTLFDSEQPPTLVSGYGCMTEEEKGKSPVTVLGDHERKVKQWLNGANKYALKAAIDGCYAHNLFPRFKRDLWDCLESRKFGDVPMNDVLKFDMWLKKMEISEASPAPSLKSTPGSEVIPPPENQEAYKAYWGQFKNLDRKNAVEKLRTPSRETLSTTVPSPPALASATPSPATAASPTGVTPDCKRKLSLSG